MLLRNICWATDQQQLLDFDASFSTDRVFRVTLNGLGASIVEETLQLPLHKVYSLSEIEGDVGEADIAVAIELDHIIVGFATAKYEKWNNRVTLTGLYVLPTHKNKGGGRALLNAIWDYTSNLPARCLWLETQNTNFPAIQFYTRLGFGFCGFDTALYENAADDLSEIAFYFCRFVQTPEAMTSG